MRLYPQADQKYLITKSSVILGSAKSKLDSPIGNADFEDRVDMLCELGVCLCQNPLLSLAPVVEAVVNEYSFDLRHFLAITTYAGQSSAVLSL